MAKPIRATPKLKGEDAEEFITKMISVEKTKISALDKKLAHQIKTERHLFRVV